MNEKLRNLFKLITFFSSVVSCFGRAEFINLLCSFSATHSLSNFSDSELDISESSGSEFKIEGIFCGPERSSFSPTIF